MRGDSLRDFYAKTLAVVGLGLLAGAGAIVDYWPIGGPLPAVSRVAGLDVRTPVVLPGAPDSIPAPIIRAAAPRPIASVVVAANAAPISSIDVVLPPAPLMVALNNDLQYGPFVTLPAVDTIDEPTAFDVLTMEDLGERPVLATGDATDDSHSMLQDALRRTRNSLRGARGFFGGQIDKIQGMVGAVKRASPFWDVSGVAPR